MPTPPNPTPNGGGLIIKFREKNFIYQILRKKSYNFIYFYIFSYTVKPRFSAPLPLEGIEPRGDPSIRIGHPRCHFIGLGETYKMTPRVFNSDTADTPKGSIPSRGRGDVISRVDCIVHQ